MKKALALILSIGILFSAAPKLNVSASSSVTVNCGSTLRAVTHCASGSLYGINETLPANIDKLVKPLNPAVFTNPARAGSAYQQPTGAAIPVASRISGTTGKVMIRLADICPNWPYTFPGMTSWLNSVKSVMADVKASGLTNIYGYEIWNEPCYTWNTANGTHENLWKKTYDVIKAQDSSAKVIGASEGYYNHTWMTNFLTFCKNNNCLPDIICWHELSSNGSGSLISNLTANIADYRAIETSLGISARPISINEYCDVDHALEGQPGSAARYIAKFERAKVDSACLSWWWTAYPGRLGSLLASNTQKGAGWWFYKWYGDMTGNMVSVTPPNDASELVDGFACVDSSAKYVSCLFGGDNDGTVNVTFKNLPSFIGSSAIVKVEAVDWSGKDVVSSGPYTKSATQYTVSNNQITVPVTGCNNNAGYRIYITPGVSSSTTRYEAENAYITEANVFSSSNASGSKYVGQIDFNDSTTPIYSYVDFAVYKASAGTYTMKVTYANGNGSTSIMGLAYNGSAWSTLSFPVTSGWANFSTVTTTVNLNAGINIIRLAKGSPYFSGGTGYAELDCIDVY